jgi:hypothetical protein
MAQYEEVRQGKAYKYSHKSGTNMTTTAEQDYDSPAAQHIDGGREASLLRYVIVGFAMLPYRWKFHKATKMIIIYCCVRHRKPHIGNPGYNL